MRGDTFIAQQSAGIRWLHVHPDYLVTDTSWEVVQLAAEWRDGRLPEAGGVLDQAAWLSAAVKIVHGAWGKLEAARDRRNS